jgi:hypothetical protein
MRTLLAAWILGACTEQNYPSMGYTETPSTPTDTATPAPAPEVRAARYEWAAGACDPVQIPAGSIVQLLDCNDATDGVTQCWPDSDQRLTIIDGTGYVLCPDDPLSPDSYYLTVLSIG